MNFKVSFWVLVCIFCASCQVYRKYVPNGVYPEMVRISFSGGKKIYFAKYPVTVEQFAKFVNDSNYLTDAEKNPEEGCWGIRKDKSVGWMKNENWKYNRLNQNKDHPVICVSWEDAEAYAKWLSYVTGDVYRLPRVNEWEFAANGENNSKYYYGDDEKEVCKYINHADIQFLDVFNEHALTSECDDGYSETSPVGTYYENDHGLFDMYGNVWEWQSECIDRDKHQSKNCTKYALKGASYASNPTGIVIGFEIGGSKNMRTTDYGFRVVKDN